MPLPVQAKLARFLETGELEMPADGDGERADTRVVASTEEDLAEEVRLGTFSDELYLRLSVVHLALPPLRRRAEDIPDLVDHFVKRASADLQATITGVDGRGVDLLRDYDWPGNLGELENVIKRACVLARGKIITVDEVRNSLEAIPSPSRGRADAELPDAVRRAISERCRDLQPGDRSSAFHEILAVVQAALVREALRITGGNQVKAAALLGLNRTTLRKKITLYEL